jgi:hypothetical protein
MTIGTRSVPKRPSPPFCLIICITAILVLSTAVRADEFALLKGFWECTEEGARATLEFKTKQRLVYNGTAYSYQLAPGVFQVQDDSGVANYFYAIEDGILMIMSMDGSISQCRKGKKPQKATTGKKPSGSATAAGGGPWPPRYVKPQPPYDEVNPSNELLLYKFAGRWDHVTTYTLTNLFLKPDGTYEEAYEAGYSGTFTDQGGYQTGSWGAAGADNERGYWQVVGGLRTGSLILRDQQGNQTTYQYQVHIKNGEVYWGEYFFNNRLYSVKYIYR